jgi:hypothetical protein
MEVSFESRPEVWLISLCPVKLRPEVAGGRADSKVRRAGQRLGWRWRPRRRRGRQADSGSVTPSITADSKVTADSGQRLAAGELPQEASRPDARRAGQRLAQGPGPCPWPRLAHLLS